MRLAIVTLALCAGTAFGAPAKKSSGGEGGRKVGEDSAVEFGIKGQLDVDKNDDTVAYVDVTLGYFLFRGFELGLTSLQGTTSAGLRDTNGVFIEYDFVNSSQFVPFFGVAIKHAAPVVDSVDQRDSTLGSIFFGNNLVIAPNAALSFTVQMDFANEPVFGPPGDRKKTNREANLGLRFYF